MGRYTLSMETYDNQTVDIRFKKAGKMTSKVSLKTIDKLTTEAENQDDLLGRIFNYANAKKISITYMANKIKKTTFIAYQDKKDLLKLDTETDSTIDVNNTVFNKNMYIFLEMLEEKDFFLFSMDSNLLTYKQKEYIEMRIENGVYTKYYEDKIKKYSSAYRQFRNILFLIELYQAKKHNRINTKNQMDILEDYDPDEDILFSEEERKQFQEYMDNLPDEVPDYMEEEYESHKVKRV